MSLPEEMDTWRTDEIVCPYCGHKHSDSYEFFEGGNECADVECHSCEKEFLATQRVEISYKTRRKEDT